MINEAHIEQDEEQPDAQKESSDLNYVKKKTTMQKQATKVKHRI